MTDPAESNPLQHATSATWDRLIASVNPPAMLVAIRGMMSAGLRARCDPDDVWQETLLHAFRDRAACEWRGLASFRRWLLEVARHRVHDLADAANAAKRGAGKEQRFADRDLASGSHGDDHYAGPCQQTTPGQVAADREMADRFERALAAVPDEWRDVVRLRLFEDCDLEHIGVQLGLGVEAVRYRFRHGAEAYRRELRRARAIDVDSGGVEPGA
ncbi:MAG: sigma-70 family RNA polymerase sigma factor [Planctomycetota bacterium]